MHAHLKLFSRIFINEGGTEDSMPLYFCRKRYRPYELCVVAKRGVYDLLHRSIKDLVLVGAHADAQFLRSFFRNALLCCFSPHFRRSGLAFLFCWHRTNLPPVTDSLSAEHPGVHQTCRKLTTRRSL